jgi:two-component system, response regulator YesN
MERISSPGNPPVLLFVDDDENWDYLFCREFNAQAPDWKIVSARDGLDARRQMVNIPPPHALVTDLDMPTMNGIELIEWVRQQLQFRLLPIVVLTGMENPSQRQQCAALEVDSYLEKPNSMDDLRESVRYIVKLCEQARWGGQEPRKCAEPARHRYVE